MKTLIQLLIAVPFTIIIDFKGVQAQNFWSLNGNAIIGSKYLGTRNNQDIRMCTNNGSFFFDATKQKMIIKNDGNVGIAYDGTNIPYAPSNKFLLQNGTLGYNPYDNLYTFGLPSSAIGFYSISIGATGGYNIPILAAAINDGATKTNIGVGINVGGIGSTNIGTGIKVSGGTASNSKGITLDMSGNNAIHNLGIGMHITGANAIENQGMKIKLDDAAYDNSGIVMELSNATNQNMGIHIECKGSAADTATGIYVLAQDATTFNIGGNFNAAGTSSYNNAIYANAKDASLNIGASISAGGDNAVANIGVGVAVTGNNTLNNIGMNMQVSGSNADVNKGIRMSLTDAANKNSGMSMKISNGISENLGISAECSGSAADTNTGIWTLARDAQNFNIGGNFNASGNAIANNGLYVSAIGANTYNTGANIIAKGDNAQINYGVIGRVDGSGGSVANYGIYGAVPGTGSGQNPPTNGFPATPNFAGYFDGDLFCSDTYFYSDEKLKNNIKDYSGALMQLNQLKIKSYTFKTMQYPDMNMPQGERIGILSSDFKKVFPNLVKQSVHPGIIYGKENVSFEAVNYTALIPVLIQGMKEQQEIIDEYKKELTELKTIIENESTRNISSSHPELLSVGKLNQNKPNPFTDETVIAYELYLSTSQASILIFDMAGKQLKKFDNIAKGSGSVTINAKELYPGMFLYALIIDGKEIDIKRMILTD